MRDEIASIASTAFENGTMTQMGALLTSNNPQAVMNQASLLLQMSSDRSAQIKQFIATAAQLASAQQMARRTEQGIATPGGAAAVPEEVHRQRRWTSRRPSWPR